MKLNPQKTLTHPLTSDYVAYCMRLMRPYPPTAEAVKRAQFVDKTYQWMRN